MKIENNNERLGLPSASGLQRLFTCPASYWREQEATQPEIETENQIVGTRIHAALSGQLSEEELSDSEKFLYKNILKQFKNFSDEIKIKIEPQDLLVVENRLFLFDDDGQPLMSGQPDLVFRNQDCYFVVDYKSGKQFPNINQNWQLRALAVLVDEWYGTFHKGFLVLICPDRYEWTYFNKADLTFWRKEIINNIKNILNTPKELLREQVNEGCKYCRSVLNCPAFSVATMSKTAPFEIKTKDDVIKKIDEIFQKNWAENRVEYNAKLMYALKTIADVYDQIKDKAREQLLINQDAFGGLINLREGRKIIKTADRPDLLQMFRDVAAQEQLNEKDFEKCLKINLNDFCLALYNQQQIAKGKNIVKTVAPKFKEQVIEKLKELSLVIEEQSKPELEFVMNKKQIENKK